jgi:hypothetical protein
VDFNAIVIAFLLVPIMKSLLDSRKFWITLVSSLCVGIVGVAGILTKADKEYIIAIIAAVAYQVSRLVDGIAREDAAKATPPPMAQAGGTIINQSSPPPPPDARDLTPSDALKRTNWPSP